MSLLFACTAQDSCLRPWPYKIDGGVQSPLVVEGMADGLAGFVLEVEVGVGAALAEAA